MSFNYPEFLHKVPKNNGDEVSNTEPQASPKSRPENHLGQLDYPSDPKDTLSGASLGEAFQLELELLPDKFDLLYNKLASYTNRRESIDANLNLLPVSSAFNHHQLMPNNSNTSTFTDVFNLPIELQGGVGTISSRRPSYAAESFTRSMALPPISFNPSGVSPNPASIGIPDSLSQQNQNPNPPESPTSMSSKNVPQQQQQQPFPRYNDFQNHSQNRPAFSQNYFDQFNDSFANFNLNSNFNDFQARRPSQLVDFGHFQHHYQPQLPSIKSSGAANNGSNNNNDNSGSVPGSSRAYIQQHRDNFPPPPMSAPMFHPPYMGKSGGFNGGQLGNATNSNGDPIILENGLMLKDQYIITSPELKRLYMKTLKYYQNPHISTKIINELNGLLANPIILKLIGFIKNLNNLTFNHKMLCLVINKNGKFDLLSCPINSNIYLQKDDLVIVDGDRGKDLVMIAEPLVNLNFAILFNFLKKLEHLKSLTIIDGGGTVTGRGSKKSSGSGTHLTLLNASAIINAHSNEDNEFIITLPTKQVLRLATPEEVHEISGKFLEEKKAFITCHNKIKELNLECDLQLINVEYQLDFKKLFFYYFANFKRIDFRVLIKELFKIYKTRIWLCAVLPYDRPEMYVSGYSKKKEVTESSKDQSNKLIPAEYDLTNDQILNFSINELNNLQDPSYFHLINLLNLIEHLKSEAKGYFYGFGNSKQDQQEQQNYNSSRDYKLSGRMPSSFDPFAGK
ncbi:uncharacterized protein KQ657_004410 [Scheffersomyces spartinae]|uniref:PSP1 C-terminal domain-containing protein n=1 Tax=Scheffersomyces spartinae TaxID=45513 RepID=A0A9P8AJG2_9ASCO|nr:uncharacterized protein KQ657_004410 [Scheffersomyces spartinae]KAG7194731.1 hypothetical protein KQ657_004410 [Scheffersomyces spartinae]